MVSKELQIVTWQGNIYVQERESGVQKMKVRERGREIFDGLKSDACLHKQFLL